MSIGKRMYLIYFFSFTPMIAPSETQRQFNLTHIGE